MPWRVIFRKYFQEKFEQDLSENRFIRRLAQLTVYQFIKTTGWGRERISQLPQQINQKRFIANFINNLKKEIQQKQKPPKQ